MKSAVSEIHWIADHKFVGTFGPGYMAHNAMPPLYDPYWEPFWTACEERGIAIVVHAGFGTPQGKVFPVDVQRGRGGGGQHREGRDVRPRERGSRRVGDVLQRFPQPQRRFAQAHVATHVRWRLRPASEPEVRADRDPPGLDPATLRHLDGIYDQHRADLAAQRKPSEYWKDNCLAGASFIHKAEVQMRHEIGVESISFGRDYPHPESTWPHTREWLRDAFEGVPDDELRLMLGENAIRFFDLDRARLMEIADRIGPTVEEIHAGGEVRPDLNFAARSGYLKPAEGEDKLALVDELLQKDLVNLVGSRH